MANYTRKREPSFFFFKLQKSKALFYDVENTLKTRKHSNRMRTDRAVRPSSERVAMWPIVDRQTPVKTLPSPCGR